MRIAVIGGGAIGSYYAGLLTHAGNDVRLFTRGAHLDVIRATGLTIRTTDGARTIAVTATDSAAQLEGVEYAILAVKSYSLPEVALVLVSLARGGATIVPLLNGIDIDDRLVALGVPRPSLLPGLTTISVVRSAPGVVERRSAFQRIVIGEPDREPSPRAQHLAVALQQAGIEARVSADIRLDLWRKFAFLAPMAAACGLLRQSVGGVRATAAGRDLITGALREIIEVGRAAGVSWSDHDEASTLGSIEALPATMKPSFLLDLERGGPTELDVLSGTVSRLGRELGITTPIHTEVTTTLEGSPSSMVSQG
jgi:2-dehydropantoate 2-reductase